MATCEEDLSLMSEGGEDYTPVNRSVIFSGTNRSEQVVILTLSDNLLEEAESFSLVLNHEEGESVLLMPSESTVWIKDNDSKLRIITLFLS